MIKTIIGFYKRTVLILLLVVHILNTYAYDCRINGIYYILNESTKTAEVTYGNESTNSYSGDVVIPQSISYNNKNYKVNSIASFAFRGCDNLSSVSISNSVVTIGSSAFYGCPNLKTINIPNGVVTIKDGAFAYCTGLTSLIISQSVENIDESAFDGCSRNLESIVVNENNSYYESRNNANAIIKKSTMKLLIGCKNTIIPDGVKSIGRWAFNGCVNLKSIIFPTSLIEIGEAAFYGCCNIISITIPLNVKTISGSAFGYCGGLQSIKVDVNNSYYDSRNDCNAIIKKSDNSLMRGCINTIIPEGITSLDFASFSGIEELTSIHLPQSIKTIGPFAFAECSSLPSIELPQNLIIIDQGAFEKCSNLSSIVIPETVSSISSLVFMYCRKLSLVESKIKIPFDIGGDCFSYIATDAILRVPKGTKSEYNNFPNWVSNFKEIVEEIGYYPLSIKSTGNGYATYNGTSVRNNTSTFNVEEGASVTITFTPDNGNRIKSVKVNNADVTPSISNNSYTISNISSDTSVDVEFEVIPSTTYTLFIKATGNGYASYNGTSIRGKTSSFTVEKGTSATITFTPDNGNRIKSVKVNNADVTSSVSNNSYTITNITRDTSLDVEFEAIPTTTYTLSVTATGNGSVTYNNISLKNQTQTFILSNNAYATIAISPESGYRIKSVVQNGLDVTSYVNSNNQYTTQIKGNTTLIVTFEAIPVTIYTLSITASGNGTVNCLHTTVKNQTQSFSIEEGTSVTITFTPDNGNSVDKVKVNGTDVTSQITGNRYVIESMSENTTIETTFKVDINALTVDGVNYVVSSYNDKTIVVVGGDYGKVLTVPATVSQNGTTWKVVGVDNEAFKNSSELAAIIWNPEAKFTASVNNPNLLLYVKNAQYAPATIQNAVVNGSANNIVLTDAESGNEFYCPQTFTAQKISYTHNYQMQTGIDEVKGWETIALPFTVQTISHATKGTLRPFATWMNGDSERPFWLYQLTGSGFEPASSIQAYTPYIISMPNNPQYDNEWLLNGVVTFSASAVTVGKTEDVQESSFKERTFVPCYEIMGAEMGLYALNVKNQYETNDSGMPDGSMFVLNMRKIHPFEAYLKTSTRSPQYAIGIFDGMTMDVEMIETEKMMSQEKVYDLQGRKINSPTKKGVYIVNGKKLINR